MSILQCVCIYACVYGVVGWWLGVRLSISPSRHQSDCLIVWIDVWMNVHMVYVYACKYIVCSYECMHQVCKEFYFHMYILFSWVAIQLIIIIIYLYNQVEYSEILSKTFIKNMTKQLSMAIISTSKRNGIQEISSHDSNSCTENMTNIAFS